MNLSKVLFVIFVFVKSTEQDSLDSQHSQVVNVTLSSLEEAALTAISTAANEFAIKLYAFLGEKEGNVIVSPLSLQMVLVLAYTGAKGNTASELAEVLSLVNITDETKLLGHRGLIKVIQDPVKLSLADRMYVDKAIQLKEDFQKNAKEYFSSSAEPLDFKTAPEESRKSINSWVETLTNENIKDLLAAGTVSSTTRLLLVNAIHFKSNWKAKFDASKTKKQKFSLSSTKTVQVEMMNTKSKFNFFYDNELNAKFLRLDYDGGKFEMSLILPDDPDGLIDLEPKLETINISERINKARSTTVNVYLPKFKIEKTMDLKNTLKAMGSPTMFSDSADFGGVTDEKLTIDSVVQKAFIEVYEEGTEAAGSTAVKLNGLAVELTLEEYFIADHPFIFIIFHKKFQIPLFFGRYAGPE